MGKYSKKVTGNEEIFIGIDLHNQMWYVTIRTSDVELFKGAIAGEWEALRNLLEAYRGQKITAVYEAGYFGYWLCDELMRWGADCLVTPPSLVPQEVGNLVKTDKRDSRKLAYLLAKGMLKRVYVPSPAERADRNVVRRRRQLIGDRIRTQNRIKAELRFNGIKLIETVGKWSKQYVTNLHRWRFTNRYQQESFQRLLDEYDFISQEIDKQTRLLKELAASERYQERVKILCSIPGIGEISAMEILVELQDVARFQRADQLAAYVGLTPTQHSSANKIRMGRITRAGKHGLRAILVEASWQLIRKDEAMQQKYQRIKARTGSKRAIVAIARTLLIRARRILLDGKLYQVGLVA